MLAARAAGRRGLLSCPESERECMELPPILQVRGMHVVEIGEDEHGAFIKFAANRARVRQVTLYMLAGHPVNWEYVYAVYDASTKTVITYKGHYGDPSKDQPLDVRGSS